MLIGELAIFWYFSAVIFIRKYMKFITTFISFRKFIFFFFFFIYEYGTEIYGYPCISADIKATVENYNKIIKINK